MWNPVKELKAERLLYFPAGSITSWNPVKELKAIADPSCAESADVVWNPVKELKDKVPQRGYSSHRSRCGIR